MAKKNTRKSDPRVRGEDGLTPAQSQMLTERAARNGWVRRWPTHLSAAGLKRMADEHEDGLSLTEKATLETWVALVNGDQRAKSRAVRAVLAMEHQNQRDELEPSAGVAGDQHVHFHQHLTSQLSDLIDKAALTPGLLEAERDRTRDTGPRASAVGDTLTGPAGPHDTTIEVELGSALGEDRPGGGGISGPHKNGNGNGNVR